MLVKAVATALRKHMIFNSTLENDTIKVLENINIGVAVAIDKGLVVPVVPDADQKSLTEIASTLEDLLEKAKQGRLAKENVSGGTLTITNLGMYGVSMIIPIINPPETAILGAGNVVEKPVIRDGQICIKPIIRLSLAFDHRVVDGAPAAQFLQEVKTILETQLQDYV
jgi:pyruvate dehydrogenase E2 component (dihydrolipoamide acetyltransferase)